MHRRHGYRDGVLHLRLYRLIFWPLIALVIGCNHAPSPPAREMAIVPSTPPPSRAYLLHLPGVSGESVVDHTLVQGFREGHLEADVEIYDWTEHDPGVPALQAIGRNKKQAKLIAEKLTARFRADPRGVIYVTSHSGGAGLAAWALEDLPPEVKVERAVFIAPALSRGYDLSGALGHVRDKTYVFYSDGDGVILNVGTKVFGTIDGVYGPAAGYGGFIEAKGWDTGAYARLVQIPYDPKWGRLGHYGDHIGPMSAAFSREVLVPLLEGRR